MFGRNCVCLTPILGQNRKGRKEMFYLTTHSTHFILQLYGVRHMVKDHSDSERGRRKEGNVLFNDALNIFYLWLYGVTHMVKDHSDSEREETRCHMGYSF